MFCVKALGFDCTLLILFYVAMNGQQATRETVKQREESSERPGQTECKVIDYYGYMRVCLCACVDIWVLVYGYSNWLFVCVLFMLYVILL